MPFKSEKQRRYMHANLPDIANRWERDYASGGIAELNQELNSLPEYYMPFPAAQGGRIGFAEGPKIPEEFLEDLKRKNYYKLLEEYRRWKEDYERRKDLAPTQEAAQGGLIPAHEAGIYGLAEGGQLVKPGPGRPGYGGHLGHHQAPSAPESTSSGDNGRPSGMPEHLSYTPPAKTTTTTVERDNGKPLNIHRDTGLEEEAYVMVDGKKVHQPKWGTKDDPREQIQITGTEDLEELAEIDRENALRKLRFDTTLTKQERKNLEVGVGIRKAKPKSNFLGWIGKGLLAVATMGVLGPGAAKLAQYYSTGKKIKTAWDSEMMIGIKDHFTNIKSNRDKQKNSKLDLYKLLPIGHPERIALQAELGIGKKPPTEVPDREEGAIQETSITMDVEKVNDAKADIARLEQKYLEMDEASEAALLRQREMEAKKQAWLRQLRQTYMSAQGGRVPQGYNTGGLSNLFKLKNV